MTLQQKNRKTGIFLSLVVAGLVIYSLVVINTRGNLPQPKNLTYWQKIFRGL